MRKHLRKYLPNHDTVRCNRWLAPFCNALLHPRLWHLNRHSAALAVAIGLFCGLIPGPLQMLGAAIACVALRVNLPLALLTTLYTNPLTIVPLYVVAYAMGRVVFANGSEFVPPPAWIPGEMLQWAAEMSAWMMGQGKPLFLGLALLASLLAVTGYFAVRLGYRYYLVRVWHKRRERRAASRPSPSPAGKAG